MKCPLCSVYGTGKTMKTLLAGCVPQADGTRVLICELCWTEHILDERPGAPLASIYYARRAPKDPSEWEVAAYRLGGVPGLKQYREAYLKKRTNG